MFYTQPTTLHMYHVPYKFSNLINDFSFSKKKKFKCAWHHIIAPLLKIKNLVTPSIIHNLYLQSSRVLYIPVTSRCHVTSRIGNVLVQEGKKKSSLFPKTQNLHRECATIIYFHLFPKKLHYVHRVQTRKVMYYG